MNDETLQMLQLRKLHHSLEADRGVGYPQLLKVGHLQQDGDGMIAYGSGVSGQERVGIMKAVIHNVR